MDGTTVRHLNPWLLSVLERLDDFAHKLAALVSRLFRRKIASPSLVAFDKGKRRKLPVHRAIHKFRRKPVDQIVEPCPGIYEVLRLLQDKGVKMGIISNGLGKGYGHDILDTFNLSEFFPVQLFREDLNRAKPHPDAIVQALEIMGAGKDSGDVVWCIGDRGKDIKAAIAAQKLLPCKVQPIGYNINAALAVLENNLGPDHIFMGWVDLIPKIKRLFGDKG